MSKEQYRIPNPELPKEDPDYVARVDRENSSKVVKAATYGAGILAVVGAALLSGESEDAPESPDQAPTVATSTVTTERNAPAGFIDINDPNATAIRIANGSSNSHEPGIFSGRGVGADEVSSIPDSVVNPGGTQIEMVQVNPDIKPQN
ncbi:MAG: hypothetical protein WAW80_02365 [Candidatus Saccharimonadales bacterium]